MVNRVKMGAVTAFAVAALSVCGGEVTLAARGNNSGKIVVTTPSEPSAVYAGEEFAKYAEQITGAKLQLVKGAGDGAVEIRCESGDEDSFRLKVEGNRLIISGGKRGMLYGVYEVLETYGGVGWFSSWCEVVPKRERFAVPDNLDRVETPAFKMRELHWKDAFEGDFASRLRINGTWVTKTTAKHGRGPKTFGGGLYRCHTFDLLLPHARHFKTHPEYYAEINGKRDASQLCLANPDVKSLVLSNLLERIAKDPNSPYYGVSQNDNGRYCRCTKCAKIDEEEGSHAGSVVRFVNDIAAEVEKHYPDKVVETLAYMYSRKPPLKARLRHNVMPCLCTLECDFSRPLETSKFKENVAFLSDIRGWSEQAKQLYIWDYTTDFHQYLKPFENLRVLQPNLQFFRKSGVMGVFEQGAYQGWHGEMAELKVWLMAKLLWNPDADVKALTKRFLNGYYGKAAPMVAKYLALLYSAERDESVNPVCIFDAVGKDPALTDEFFRKATELWNEAREAVKDDPVRSYNVRMSALAVDYTNYAKNFRPYNVSKAPSICDSSLPVRTLAALNEAKAAKRPVQLCESWSGHASRMKQIEVDASGVSTNGDGEKATVEETAFTLLAGRDKIEVRDDKTANNGSALWIKHDNWQWYAQFDMNRVRFDRGINYRVRFRLRVEKTGGEGQAFSFGIYDNRNKKNRCQRSFAAKNVTSDGYAWYELPPCQLDDDLLLWFAPGVFDAAKSTLSPVSRAIWLDAIEISRL